MFDVCIVGAGAAGLFCGARLTPLGLKLLYLEHNQSPGRKILVSGGGRCNFTNQVVRAEDYVSRNPYFVKSALSRLSPQQFLEYVEKHNIEYYEKKLGQLFCRRSSKEILQMLLQENQGQTFVYGCRDLTVNRDAEGFVIRNGSGGEWRARTLVVATGGLSFPKLGATPWGYGVAEQFGHKVIQPRAALVGFKIPGFSKLAGVSLVARLRVADYEICEDILFTHRGLSGPAALKASLHWEMGEELRIDFHPRGRLAEELEQARRSAGAKTLLQFLSALIPQRCALFLVEPAGLSGNERIGDLSKTQIRALIEGICNFSCFPEDLEGFERAEVTRGGVDTSEISSKTMESQRIPGLYFIGEVLDVTGQLGGYNFQWAWASGAAAAEAIVERLQK